MNEYVVQTEDKINTKRVFSCSQTIHRARPRPRRPRLLPSKGKEQTIQTRHNAKQTLLLRLIAPPVGFISFIAPSFANAWQRLVHQLVTFATGGGEGGGVCVCVSVCDVSLLSI